MKRKALFSIALASVLLFSTVPVSADEISNLEHKKSQSQEKKSQLEAELSDVKSEITNLEEKIQKLNKEIEKNLAEISVTEGKIKKIQQEIKITEAKIEDAKLELEKKKDILAENLRVMYSKGKVSYLEFLFRSDSMSDFLYRFNTLEDLAKANEALYQEIKDILQELKEQKAKLAEEKESLDKQKEALAEQRKGLEARQAEQLDIMQKLAAQHHHIENEVHEQEAAINVINNEIADVIRKREEARRKALEEQRRKEAEQKRNQQQQNNNSSGSQNQSGGSSNSGNTGGYGNEIEATGSFGLPAKRGTYYVSSNYGYRTHPVTGRPTTLHSGIDLAGPLGTPIYAADSGTVLYAGAASGFGHWIVIDHNNGLYSIYGHMYSYQIYVVPGQTVKKGQHIGGFGSDGQSTGSHLHFGISNGISGGKFQYVNPANYISF